MFGWRRFAPTLYVFFAVVLVGMFADFQHTIIEAQNERDRVRSQLESLSAQIESHLNLPIQAARGLVTILSTEPDMEQGRFDWLVSRMFRTTAGVRNVAAARDLVVNLVYPIDANRSALGLDYRKSEQQRDAVYHARDTGEFVLTGPVDLVQGGRAFIGRFPVFNETNGIKSFWGILSVVVDLPTLFENGDLQSSDSGLELALIRRDGSGIAVGHFLGSDELLNDDPVSKFIFFPNGSWQLSAKPSDGWGSTLSLAWFRLILTMLCLTAISLTALANQMAVQRQKAIRVLKCRELELVAARHEVEMLALHDHLTGLPNRRYFDRMIEEIDQKFISGLIQLDLDDFKAVNDAHGHTFGDKLLTELAHRLRDKLPSGDFLARMGGDEFVIICRISDPIKARTTDCRDELARIAQSLIDCVNLPSTSEAQNCRVGLSVGIHHISSANDCSVQNWLLKADHAMYFAKQKGRNRYAFSTSISDNKTDRVYSVDDLLDSLSRNQIVPFYQPQFGADGVTILGVEALARWEHPKLGTLTPQAFMGHASSLKIDCDIDQRIFELAVKDLARWDDAGLVIPKMSINVSYRRLSDPQLIEYVDAVDVDAKRVAFELLESIFLDEENSLIATNVEALKARGFRVEIDDFGTGHSSATSLLKLRPHGLKIDKSLVKAATNSRENRRLLATIVEMGRALKISVCAEGIETSEQFLTARTLGCTIFQGFLFARPMSAEHCERFLYGAIHGRHNSKGFSLSRAM